MRSFLIAIASMALAATLAGAAGDAAQDAERQLKAAINTELVDGNLKLAIEQYKKVAESGNRALAAQALVRMAECYRKIGDAQAAKVYEQILRDYADQKEAVGIARLRLGGAATVTAKGDRPLVTGAATVDTAAAISADGRLLAYIDWNRNRDVMVRDLTTGSERALTHAAGEDAGAISISKDGKQIAFERYTPPSRLSEIRIATLAGAGVPAVRRLLSVEDAAVLSPSDWSPDGKWLAVSVRRKNLTGEVALVSVQDGTLRTLKSTDWRGPVRMFFSPDGQHIAYTIESGDRTGESTIFVIATNASHEAVAVAHPSENVIMGWAPDGTHLLFASDRTGSFGLWAQPIAGGKPNGEPALLKSDIGSYWSFGLTASGVLNVLKFHNSNYLEVASIDLSAGRLLPASRPAFKRFVGSGGLPAWSPDGKFLAYRMSPFGPDLTQTLTVSAIETGLTRELRPALSYVGSFEWSQDGRSFSVTGTDLKGRRGLYRMDAQTGELSTVLAQVPGEYGRLSADQKKIFYRLAGSIFERDLSSGQERTMFRSRGAGNSASIVVSPDGQYIACVEGTRTASTLLLIPAAGGEPREILRVLAPEQLDGFRMIWTDDSRSLIVPRYHVGESTSLWLVPATGDAARRLDINVDNWLIGIGRFDLSADSRRIAFVATAGQPFAEVWALEGVWPTAPAAGRTSKK